MTAFLETLASPFFAVVDFALAAPVPATAAIGVTGVILAVLAMG